MWALQPVWAIHDRVVKREGNSRGGLIVLNFSVEWISPLLAKYHPLTSLRNFNPQGGHGPLWPQCASATVDR